MKRLRITFFLITLLCLSTAFADNDALQVTVNQSRAIIMPGDEFFISIVFENIGQQPPINSGGAAVDSKLEIRDLQYKVIIPNKFTSTVSHADYDQTASYEVIGDLGPGTTAQGVVPVKVMGSTQEGHYVVKVETTYQNSDLELINITNQFIVIVSEPKKLLEIKDIQAINASPGEEFNLTLVLESDKNLENVRVNIQPEEVITLSSDASIRKINKLIANKQETIIFTLATDKLVPTKSVQLPVNTTYFYNGIQYIEPILIGLNLKGKAELNLIDIETVPRKPVNGNEFALRLELENVGSGDAENILISLVTDLYGVKRKTVGSIKQELIGSASFDLTPGLLGFGSHRIKMQVNYEDELGEHTMIKEFDVQISVRFPTTIVVVSIIIAAGLIIYKKFFRKNKKNKKSD